MGGERRDDEWRGERGREGGEFQLGGRAPLWEGISLTAQSCSVQLQSYVGPPTHSAHR